MMQIAHDGSALADGTILRKTGDLYPLPVKTAPVSAASAIAAAVRGNLAPAAIAVPQAIAAVGTYVQTVTLWAQRAGRVANAGSVFVDMVAGNDVQQIELIPGSFITFTAPPGKVIDLGTIYVDAVTLTDGVFFLGML